MPEVKRFAVAEGVSLHALEWEGTGRPFLLVHGLSSNCRTWEGVAAVLAAAGHRVVAPDLRGHGRSDKPEDGYDFATMTSDLRTVVTALRSDVEPVVVGQSTGGNLGVELAYRSSNLVAGVVGIDGGAIELAERWPRWEDCESALAPPRFEGTPAGDVERWIRRAHPDWSDAGIAATLANLEVLADGTVRPWLTFDRHMRLLRALWEHHPSGILGEVDVPVLLIHAEHDGGPPHTAVATADGVRVEWLRGDHDLHVQQPERVAELLLEFAS